MSKVFTLLQYDHPHSALDFAFYNSIFCVSMPAVQLLIQMVDMKTVADGFELAWRYISTFTLILL